MRYFLEIVYDTSCKIQYPIPLVYDKINIIFFNFFLMKIVFNASCIQQPLTGIGHFAYQNLLELQKLLNNEIVAFQFNNPDKPQPTLASKPSSLKKFLIKFPMVYSLKRFLTNQKFKKFIAKEACDIYLEPNFISYNTHISSIPVIYDLSFIRHPETHPKFRRKIFKKYLKKTIQSAKAIVTISAFSKAEIMDIFKVPDEKIHVAYCGASHEFKPRSASEVQATLAKYQLNYRQFILGIGTFEPRKNLIRTCEAYANLPASLRQTYPLVLCGASGWGDIQLSDKVKKLIENQEIHVLNYVSNQELYELTASARCACYASIYEGFGLPVLEAMQSATPVITSNVSSMPEVAGDAGILVNPYEISDIQHGLEQLLSNDKLCEELTEKGLVQAQKFSWEKTAKIILQACRA